MNQWDKSSTELANALHVIALTPHIADYLRHTDQKALEQVDKALAASGQIITRRPPDGPPLLGELLDLVELLLPHAQQLVGDRVAVKERALAALRRGGRR